MDTSHLAAFALAYLAIVVLPGPGVTALVARVLARGLSGTPAFIAGFVAGSLCWFSIAATGLAVLAATFATVFLAIRYAGAAYLLYLAWKFWTAAGQLSSHDDAGAESHGRLFLTGLAINLGNPKAIVFFIALLPTVIDLGSLTWLGFSELTLTAATIASGVLTVYALLAARTRSVFRSPRSFRIINRTSGTVLAITAVGIATR